MRLLCPLGSSRQEYWSGLPCPSLGQLPNSGIEPRSPTLQADSLQSEPQGKLLLIVAPHRSLESKAKNVFEFCMQNIELKNILNVSQYEDLELELIVT